MSDDKREECAHDSASRLYDRGEYGASTPTDWQWCRNCGAVETQGVWLPILADHAAARYLRQLEERVREMEAALVEAYGIISGDAIPYDEPQNPASYTEIEDSLYRYEEQKASAESRWVTRYKPILSPQESSGTEGEGK